MKAVTLFIFSAALGLSSITSADADTLSRIAERYGIDLERLIASNPGLDQRRLHSDEPIVIPKSDPRAPADSRRSAASSTSKPEPISSESYTVKPGDTLSTIARRHRTSSSELKVLNHLIDSQTIRTGQQIRVPAIRSSAVSSGSRSSAKSRFDSPSVRTPAPAPGDERRPRGPVVIITNPRPVVSHG